MRKTIIMLLLLFLFIFPNLSETNSYFVQEFYTRSQQVENFLYESRPILNDLWQDICQYIVVSLETISEASGSDFKEKNNGEIVFSFKGVSLGDSLDDVISILGDPKRTLVSEYGFQWYIFHENYHQYLQVGIKNNKVVALYSNTPHWENDLAINIGSSQNHIQNYLKDPLNSIVKGNITYLLPIRRDYEVYQIKDYYLTVFYDIYNDNKICGLQVIEKNIEESYHHEGYYKPGLEKSYELQIFDLANATRVLRGLKPFSWDEKASVSARKHSNDMAAKNYFNHINLKGATPFDRMKEEGIIYQKAGENIAAGQQNAIFAHEGWMNSLSHRKAILDDFSKLGTGVSFGGPLKVYYTQNFYTPIW